MHGDVVVEKKSMCDGDKSSNAISNLAKFKAAQDLRIQTENLPDKSGVVRSSGSKSTGSLSRAPGVDSSSSTSSSSTSAASAAATTESAETPVPPSSTGKKRRRRTANQIDRKYPCPYPGCTKAYGSEGSLTQHQRLKHRAQPTDPSNPTTQATNFFLPLHRGRSATISGTGAFLPAVSLSRAVNIRPAMEGLMPLQFDLPRPAGLFHTDQVLGDHGLVDTEVTSRQHSRARSNSMPVSFSAPASLSQLPTLASGSGTPRPQSTRRSRVNSTPRSKTGGRRTKSRSKSESLNELDPFVECDGIRPPIHERSVSESTGSFGFGTSSLDWSSMTQGSSPSSSYVDSPHASGDGMNSDHAVDNDILSSLVNADDSDEGDSSLEFGATIEYQPIPAMTQLEGYDADQGSLVTAMYKTTTDLPTGTDDFAMKEAWQFVSTHLEKMSMVVPDSLMPSDEIKSELPFETMAVDSFSIMPVLSDTADSSGYVGPQDTFHGLQQQHPHTNSNTTSSVAKMESQIMWPTKGFAVDPFSEYQLFMDLPTTSTSTAKQPEKQPPSPAYPCDKMDEQYATGLSAFGDVSFGHKMDYEMDDEPRELIAVDRPDFDL